MIIISTSLFCSARGTGEKQKNPSGYAGFIKGLLGTAKGGANYEVVYPATTDYTNGPKQGAADAMKYLTKQKSKCPKQKYVLIGYSEGAMVVVQLLAKQGVPASDISSIIMYGNPYWLPNQKWNVGTAVSPFPLSPLFIYLYSFYNTAASLILYFSFLICALNLRQLVRESLLSLESSYPPHLVEERKISA